MASKSKGSSEQKVRERGDKLFMELVEMSETPKDALNVLAYVCAKYIANVTTHRDKLVMELVVLVRGSLGL